jgi:hypothetical protein
MSDWLHGLPVLWMAILVFGFTYLVTAGIYAVIAVFAVGERRSWVAVALGCDLRSFHGFHRRPGLDRQ